MKGNIAAAMSAKRRTNGVHYDQHAADRQEVDEQADRALRSETLDGRHVVGDRAQNRADPVSVVILQRKVLQMVVGLLPQIVGNPLPILDVK